MEGSLDRTLKIIGQILLVLGAGLFLVLISAGFWGHDYLGLKGLPGLGSKHRAMAMAFGSIMPGAIILGISESMKKKRLKKELMDEGRKKYLEGKK